LNLDAAGRRRDIGITTNRIKFMDVAMSIFGDLDLGEPQNGNHLTGNGTTEDEHDGPLVILRPSTLQLLSTMLNPIKIIPTDSGLPRDWRGLAELAGLTAENISYLEVKPDPTQELLKLSRTVSNSRFKTVKDLKACLAIIDRYDVVDDGESLMEADISFYRSRINLLTTNGTKASTELNISNDRDNLTYGDISGEIVRYDAFILNADEDSEFADEVVMRLETDYNLKLCVKDRDLLPGVMFEHEAIGKVIEERCNRLLVILSPSFLQSEGNKFLVSYTQALALETRQRKIIPCMYKRCERPMSVRYSYCLDYNRAGTLWNFWEKLSNSIISTPKTPSSTNQSIGMEPLYSPASINIKSGTSLPDYSHWDSKKGEDLSTTFDLMSLPNPKQDPCLSSSLPQYTGKSSSKKWYSKVIGSTKKKKSSDKKCGKKLLATAD